MINGTRTRKTAIVYYPSNAIATKTRERTGAVNPIRESRYYADDGRIRQSARHRVLPDTTTALIGTTKTYGYDDELNAGLAETAWGNGQRAADENGTYTFNARDQLIKWQPPGTGFFAVNYEVDGAGAIKKKVEGPRTTTYSYAAGKLDHYDVEEIGGTPEQRDFEYNAFGSLEYEKRDPTPLSDPSTPDKKTLKTYVYDSFQRLTSFVGVDAAGTSKAPVTYEYDALDRRDAKVGKDGRTDYAYVGSTERLSREDPATGNGANYDYDSGLQPLGQEKTKGGVPEFRFFVADPSSGTTLGLEGANGETGSYGMGPYGEEGATSGEAEGDNPMRFQGFFYDGETALYDMQARYYSPVLSRFLSPDRYESPGADQANQIGNAGLSRYAFAGANPVNNVEIDGHCAKTGEWGPCTPLGRAPTKETAKQTGKIVEAQRVAMLQPTTGTTDASSNRGGYVNGPKVKTPKYAGCAPNYVAGKKDAAGCAGKLPVVANGKGLSPHGALQGCGMAFFPCDLADTGLNLVQGNFGEAAFSAFAAIPWWGDGARGARWADEAADGSKGTKPGDDLDDAGDAGTDRARAARPVDKGRRLATGKIPAFDNAGVPYTEHFVTRLAQREGRGGGQISAQTALDAYNRGTRFYDPTSRAHIRYDRQTEVVVVLRRGRAHSVFDQPRPSSSWHPVRYRDGR